MRHVTAGILAGSVVCGSGLVAGTGVAGAAPGPATVALTHSYLGAPDATEMGSYSSSSMGVEVVLQPRDPSTMNRVLADLYDPASATYHQWLPAGSFAARFAPGPSARRSVSNYLRRSGLRVLANASPFLVRAVGPSSQVAAAFSTTIDDYRTSTGQTFFAEAAPVRVPASLAATVAGVVGL